MVTELMITGSIGAPDPLRVSLRLDRLHDFHSLDHLARDGVVGRQRGVGDGDDEELAAGAPGRLDLGLCHRHDALGVRGVVRRRFVDRIAGARAGAGAGGVAPLDHEVGDDPVKGRAVEDAVLGQVLERGRRLRVLLRVEGDLERAAACVDHRDEILGRWLLRRRIEAHFLRLRSVDALAL